MTLRNSVTPFLAAAAIAIAVGLASAETLSTRPLELETKILLGDVRGRIDHMAIDLARRRLFVAELGNNTVGVVDLNERKVVHVLPGLKEPQGVAYVASSDTLVIANAGDGSVLLLRGADYGAAGRIDLGDDADNVRVDAASNRVLVGYGSGAIAIIDPAGKGKIADIALKGHPESFQLARSARRIFANVPRAREIAVIDLAAGKQTASWPINNDSNFPMALDEATGRVLVVLRSPPQLRVFSMQDGRAIATAETCGDADDLFVDARRHRVYISCGDGYLDVLDIEGESYRRVARIRTASGARTSLFVPELDRLFVAARANPGEAAGVWVFRPAP
jgi:DNA-binding beta-propeller fold protein YncE